MGVSPEPGEVTTFFCFSPAAPALLRAQARLTSWPKENPGSWFSEFKRGKLVRRPGPAAAFSAPLSYLAE